MQNLICSMAGKSSRFPGTRPKALLTHPYGCSMLTASLVGVANTIKWDNIYIVALESQVNENIILEIKKEINEYCVTEQNISFVLLSSETKNQPETIYRAIVKQEIKGSIFIKDCDNQFTIDVLPENNGIAVSKLGNEKIVPGNKNYIQLDQFGNISNIVEKQIISDTFGCGGYYFKDASDFITTYDTLRDEPNLYISHIIYKMIAEEKTFSPISTSKYLDWGTLEEWQDYIRTFRTFFIDLDGVLLKNSGKLTDPNWHSSEIIKENVDQINSLSQERNVIIITTSRPSSMEEETVKLLEDNNINYNSILFGLMHCKRILINDFANTNPYPSAIAINIKRDSPLINLKDL